jgi:hypothetical protein
MVDELLPIATTGDALWDSLVAIAGLDPNSDYDRELRDKVGRALKLGWGSDIGEEIARAGVGPTEVLVAVLGALQPWAEMMRDLIELMRGCGANRTRTQLRADVDIAAASEQLELDLGKFVESVEIYEEVADAAQAVTSWPADAVQELWEILPNLSAEERLALRPEVIHWLDEYQPAESNGLPEVPWPNALPSAPTCADPELDRALKAAWSAWEVLAKTAAENSSSRRDLYEKGQKSQQEEEHDLQHEGLPTAAWIAARDHDRLLGALLEGLDDVARRVRVEREPGWEWFGTKQSPQDLIDLVDRLPVTARRENLLKRVRDLLSLPTWKQRYDLYSNWVFTVIVGTLAEVAEVKVHHAEGFIDFGFKATKMATVAELDLTVYCELRSDLIGTSEKRKDGVQPDYSILHGDPANPARSSVFEIECKQYKSAGKQNFVAALRDYARSRPKANVVLVNYGPVSDRVSEGIIGAVDIEVRDRCEVIGDLRPPSGIPPGDAARGQFVEATHDAIGIGPGAGFTFPPELPLRIDLFWEKSSPDVDLDLHLEIAEPDGAAGPPVSYRQPSAGNPVHARLVEDVRSGPGPETILIERWLDTTYRLWVHRWDDGELATCRPRIELSTNGMRRSFACPKGTGPWWCALEITGETRTAGPVGTRDAPV